MGELRDGYGSIWSKREDLVPRAGQIIRRAASYLPLGGNVPSELPVRPLTSEDRRYGPVKARWPRIVISELNVKVIRQVRIVVRVRFRMATPFTCFHEPTVPHSS